MRTDMDINYKNGINSENKTQIENTFSKEKEFISSSGIYSVSNNNSNLCRSIQPSSYTNPNPQYVNNYPLYNSMIGNNYQNNNKSFYNTQNNFRRNHTTQVAQEFLRPPAPPAIVPISQPIYSQMYQQINRPTRPINQQTHDLEINANVSGMIKGIFNSITQFIKLQK